MTTIASVIARIKRDLRRSYKEPVNKLDAAISSTTATTFSMSRSLNTLVADSVVEIDDELIYVFTVDTALKDVTDCLRGYDGTTAATHLINSIVRPNPRFTSVDIRDAIAEEIRSWEPRLFRVGTFTQAVTQGSGTRAWDFTDSANYLGRLISIKLQPSSSAYINWPYPDYRPINVQYGDIVSGQDTTQFASGWAFVVREGNLPMGLLPTGTITVSYTKRFDLSSTADSVDLETTVGIPASSLALLRFGVMYRLLAAQEAERSDMGLQDEPRRADEVKPGDTFRAAAGYKAIRDEFLTQEAEKLNALYGASSW